MALFGGHFDVALALGEDAAYVRGMQLLAAAAKGDERGVRELHAKGTDLNFTDGEGKTPLIMAVLNRKERMVALLLKFGADPSIAPTSGAFANATPQQMAHDKGFSAAEKMLSDATGVPVPSGSASASSLVRCAVVVGVFFFFFFFFFFLRPSVLGCV